MIFFLRYERIQIFLEKLGTFDFLEITCKQQYILLPSARGTLLYAS